MATKYEWYNPETNAALYITNDYLNGQQFTVGTTGTNEKFNVSSIKLLLYRVGSPGNISIVLKAVDESGFPIGDILSSGTTNGNSLTTDTSGEVREINMSSYELQPSTKYALLYKEDTFNFEVDEGHILCLAGIGSYSGGENIFYFEGWNENTDVDIYFEVWGNKASLISHFINIGDAWKNVSLTYINIGDVWRFVSSIYLNVGDVWKKVL